MSRTTIPEEAEEPQAAEEAAFFRLRKQRCEAPARSSHSRGPGLCVCAFGTPVIYTWSQESICHVNPLDAGRYQSCCKSVVHQGPERVSGCGCVVPLRIHSGHATARKILAVARSKSGMLDPWLFRWTSAVECGKMACEKRTANKIF
ncbi:uncharacterized protein ASCRUDRAFT_131868 [Ascoidea rubescens DSM 1968]|uniref:Uncharacterized protein n=1 Tax=Ascoidea rubescens DSM 1968 TaxID=1344418 RepID=A0A1D2V8A4_9ASCO|nr:hypothetical protein ASCRUDRAFT_131868 [Ascoidea rubescens DSM 1968]ODV57869.1 hypothetical protein ASCRUDRAFT_131868 [Ascoidea rubescens DSM 1968]